MFRSSKLFFAAVFIAALGFAGCQSADDHQGIVIDDVPMDRRIGTISSLGTVPGTTQGTHLLKLDDGDTILLKSLSINLDDSKYRDEVVEVRGILTYAKGEKPLMEVQSIDILESYEMETTKAPEWKTYSGALYSIRYRDDFVMEKDSDGVTFTKTIEEDDDTAADESMTQESEMEEPLKDVVSITVTSKEEDQDLTSFLSLESDETNDLLAEGFTKSKVGPHNLEAYKKSTDESLTFYVEGDANFYTLSFTPSEHPDALKNENIFYEMLATFELTSGMSEGMEEDNDAMSSRTLDIESLGDDSGSMEELQLEPVTGFETFESESVGFSLQYPKSWYFEGSNSNEPGVSQVYEFAQEPFDEGGSAVVTLSVAGSDTSDSEVKAGGVTLGKSVRGGNVEITYRGDGRYFRLIGPKSMESTLLTMAASISE